MDSIRVSEAPDPSSILGKATDCILIVPKLTTRMKELKNIIFLVILMVVALAAFITSWKLSKYSISRRDQYRNTEFQLFSKKIAWGLFWALLAIIITSIILRFF
jgi:hypothetical protein